MTLAREGGVVNEGVSWPLAREGGVVYEGVSWPLAGEGGVVYEGVSWPLAGEGGVVNESVDCSPVKCGSFPNSINMIDRIVVNMLHRSDTEPRQKVIN